MGMRMVKRPGWVRLTGVREQPWEPCRRLCALSTFTRAEPEVASSRWLAGYLIIRDCLHREREAWHLWMWSVTTTLKDQLGQGTVRNSFRDFEAYPAHIPAPLAPRQRLLGVCGDATVADTGVYDSDIMP